MLKLCSDFAPTPAGLCRSASWVGPQPYWEAEDGGGGIGEMGDHGDTPEGWLDTRMPFFWGCRAIQPSLVRLMRAPALRSCTLPLPLLL